LPITCLLVPALIVRFPDGTKEFRFPERPLEVGDSIWHEGARYHVVSVSEDAAGDQLTVTVEPDAESLGDILSSEEGALVLVPTE
jgi:hypothetical protein